MSNDRDRSIEVLLRQQPADDTELSSASPCVDAEVLAAWVDGALSGQALAEAEKHASGCVRCQALLASMAKTMPTAEPRPWWRAVSAKWLVPVAAVATALVVWVSVEPRREEAMPRPAPSAATALPETPAPETSARPAETGQNGQSLADRATRRAVELKKDAVTEQASGAGTTVGDRKAVPAPQRVDALDKTADAVSAQPAPRAGGAGGIAGAPSPVLPSAASASAMPAPVPPPQRESPTAAPGPPLPQLRAPAETAVAESVKVTPEGAGKQLSSGRGGGTVAFGGGGSFRRPAFSGPSTAARPGRLSIRFRFRAWLVACPRRC
jgi:hypothetical protein